jgi:cytochrome P450
MSQTLTPYPSIEGAESPWEYLDYLLDREPVMELPGRPNHFVISRYDDVRFVLSHPEIFTSKGRALLCSVSIRCSGRHRGKVGCCPSSTRHS